MAQYDYRCKSCNNVTTVERSMSDPEVAVSCSSCGGTEMVRIYGSVGMLGVRSSENLGREPFNPTSAVGAPGGPVLVGHAD